MHKCVIPYCRPEEDIHCIPNRWYPGMKEKDFQLFHKNFMVVKVTEEVDITPEISSNNRPSGWHDNSTECNPDYIGYLVWIKGKLLNEGEGGHDYQ